MKIGFHGAAGMVTGSKHLVELDSGVQILLDCGLFQGEGKETDLLNRHFGFSPAALKYILLSHAHIDHSGLLPLAVKQGFKGKIYCTPATFDLLKILLLDSVKIQQSDLEMLNKRRAAMGKPLIIPLFDEDDVYSTLALVHRLDFNEAEELEGNGRFMFTETGHIIGSAAIHLTDLSSGISILFSGDVGRYNDAILNAPADPPPADYILLESTYGDTIHPPVSETHSQLLDAIVHTCIRKKGRLIIPAFSVGRTQEIVYALNIISESGKIKGIPFFVDSPMSSGATEVMERHPELYNESLKAYLQHDPQPFRFDQLEYLKDREDSMALNEFHEPCVIISASGMAEAGRVKHHIARALKNHRNTILLVGFCAEGTLGHKLIRGDQEVSIYGEMRPVNAEIRSIQSLSAHGDSADLLRFVSRQDRNRVKKIFLVHGEQDRFEVFRNKLSAAGFSQIEIPSMHQIVDI
jgi:metallo-beta-lactamase family protein